MWKRPLRAPAVPCVALAAALPRTVSTIERQKCRQRAAETTPTQVSTEIVSQRKAAKGSSERRKKAAKCSQGQRKGRKRAEKWQRKGSENGQAVADSRPCDVVPCLAIPEFECRRRAVKSALNHVAVPTFHQRVVVLQSHNAKASVFGRQAAEAQGTAVSLSLSLTSSRKYLLVCSSRPLYCTTRPPDRLRSTALTAGPVLSAEAKAAPAQPKRWHVGRLDGVGHLFGSGGNACAHRLLNRTLILVVRVQRIEEEGGRGGRSRAAGRGRREDEEDKEEEGGRGGGRGRGGGGRGGRGGGKREEEGRGRRKRKRRTTRTTRRRRTTRRGERGG